MAGHLTLTQPSPIAAQNARSDDRRQPLAVSYTRLAGYVAFVTVSSKSTSENLYGLWS